MCECVRACVSECVGVYASMSCVRDHDIVCGLYWIDDIVGDAKQ